MLKSIKLKKCLSLTNNPIPLEFIVGNFNSFIYFTKNYSSTHYTINLNTNWFFNIIHLCRSIPSFYYFILDSFIYGNLVLLMSINTLLSSHKFNFILKDKLQFKTLSTFFKNSTWIEREILEVSNVSFIGLLDSRKLLQNYSLNKKLLSSFNLNLQTFNSIKYELSLNHF